MKLSHQSGLPRVVGSVQNYPGQPGVPLHSQSKHKEANAAAEDDDEQLEEVEVEPVMDRGLEAVENRKGEVLISSDGGYGDEGMHPPLAGGVTHELGSSTWAMLLLTAVAAIGGFLFGYDSGVVSGAMLKIKSDLHLVPWQEEVVVSSTVGAAILGSLGGGYLNEILGRKPIIILAALTFTLGALEMALSWNFASLTVGRIIVGLAIGLASLTTPVYIAESAPAHLRGRLVSINIVLISLGQFSAGMIDGVFAEVPGGWRWMLGLSGVPSVLMLFGMIPLPESPRWLMGKGLREESCQVLQVLRGVRADISQEVEEMQEGIRQAGDKHASLWLLLSTPHLRRALFIGCGLQLVQQLVGINTVMYYSGEIYSMAGFSDDASIWLAGFTALSQSVGLIGSVYLIERSGRRPLLLGSLGVVSSCLILLGLSFYLSLLESPSAVVGDSVCQQIDNIFVGALQTSSCYRCTQLSDCGFCASPSPGGVGVCYQVSDVEGGTDIQNRCPSADWVTGHCSDSYGVLATVGMVLYLFAFGLGMSGVPWAINAEIHQSNVRSLATSIATSCNWIANFLVASTFLTLASPQVLTAYGAFWLYSLIAVISWIWIYYSVPETKGVHMEDMAKLFHRDGDASTSSVVMRNGFAAVSTLEADESYWADGHDYDALNSAASNRGRRFGYMNLLQQPQQSRLV